MNISPENVGTDSLRIEISGAQLLLLHQVMSEATYGIRLPHFYSQIGISRVRSEEVIDALEHRLDELPNDADATPLGEVELVSSETEGRALRNALELVMRDLGTHEFSTRTGFDLEEAAQLLDDLNAALIAPLGIEKRHRIIGDKPQTAREPQAATSR